MVGTILMGSPAIFSYASALRPVLEHATITHTKVSAHPLTKGLAPEYQAFEDAWFVVHATELKLWIAIVRAAAKVVAVDDELDSFVDELKNAALIITGGDTQAQLYLFFFKNKRPSDLKKPVLSSQLSAMRDWVEPLKTSPHASLQALGVKLEKLIADADAAEGELRAAKQKNHEFRSLGERKALIDQFNALRKSSYGKLSEMPHAHPEANLPATFADRFFKPVSKPVEEEEEMTSVELVALIAEKESDVAALRERLQEVLAKEEAEAKRKEERASMEEEMKKTREEIAKQQARLAELEKKLSK